MLDKLRREQPAAVFVRTGNAASNMPMLKVNDDLGFLADGNAPYDRCGQNNQSDEQHKVVQHAVAHRFAECIESNGSDLQR